MDFKFFRKDSKKDSGLTEAPLSYWEESSVLIAVPRSGAVLLSADIFDRVEAISGVDILDSRMPDEDGPGKIELAYDGEIYEITFYTNDFHLPDMLSRQGYYFTEEEMEVIAKAGSAMTLMMDFGQDCRKSYHLQLMVAKAIVPDLVAILDESAERLVSGRWVALATESAVPPSATALFTVQAVCESDDAIWLHTHGLNRCGLYELEILNSDKQVYSEHHHLINTFASVILDRESKVDPGEGVRIGMFSNGDPIVATYVSWVRALREYDNLDLGGVSDRRESHNSRTAPIFLYLSEKDEQHHAYSKITDFTERWSDNPLFFISTKETDRMRALAQERFGIVRYMAEKGCPTLLKVGLKTDSGRSDDNLEHIWFELIEFDGDKFSARLTQEPYDISGMHEGDVGTFTADQVTDWIIYADDTGITPETAYLLI